ncbi:MAG: hypothetical protein IPG59_14860 [Candidatus Melainabacteria bacterium]|nr:MAG: hypothetical protein IPG59_14860 [Candidatus Melainabacteria bacterium]
MKLLLSFILIGIFLISGCNSDSSHKSFEVVGVGDHLGKTLREGGLKKIHEPPIQEFKEPIVYRFWFAQRHIHRCLTLKQNEQGEMFASYYEWYNRDEVTKSWKHKVGKDKASLILYTIAKSDFWNTTESVKFDELITDSRRYDVEGKDGQKYKEIYAIMMGTFDCPSICKSLCEEMFALANEEL